MKQLEMFSEAIDYEKEFHKIRAEMNKFRRSLFAQQGDLRKQYSEMSHEFELLKLNICKGKIIA